MYISSKFKKIMQSSTPIAYQYDSPKFNSPATPINTIKHTYNISVRLPINWLLKTYSHYQYNFKILFSPFVRTGQTI